MDLKRLRYFCAIVEQGQISRAAKFLNIAQPALSQRLKELEDELGMPLILRQERKWQLTRAGKFLYEKSQQLLESLDKIPLDLRSLEEAPADRLHIGAAPVCFSHVSRTIAALLKAHPDMRFRLYHGDVSLIEEWLDKRLIDLALCRRPKDAMHYITLPLPPSRFAVVYPKALLPLHDNASLRIEDLLKVPLLIPRRRRSGGVYEDLIHLFIKKGQEPDIVIESMDPQTLIQLLDHGVFAAAILPDSEVGESTAARYQVKPLDEPGLNIQTYLVYRKNLLMNSSIQAFIETLLQRPLSSDLPDEPGPPPSSPKKVP